jgi:hypothetical protein
VQVTTSPGRQTSTVGLCLFQEPGASFKDSRYELEMTQGYCNMNTISRAARERDISLQRRKQSHDSGRISMQASDWEVRPTLDGMNSRPS